MLLCPSCSGADSANLDPHTPPARSHGQSLGGVKGSATEGQLRKCGLTVLLSMYLTQKQQGKGVQQGSGIQGKIPSSN